MRALLAAAIAAALAAPAPAPTSTRVVRIDVFPADAHGRLVTGLTASDFELREDGVRQTIDSVVLVGPPPVAEASDAPIRSAHDEQAAAREDGVRTFGLFLDEYHLTPDAAVQARELLAPFVGRDLRPRDLVAMMKPLDSLLEIRATRDRAALAAAIGQLQGRKGDYTPRSAFERNYIAGDRARVDAARAQVTLSALNALVVHLGGLSHGRKTLLFVSEGLDVPRRRRGFEPMPTLETIMRSASRYNVAIYAIDPAAGGEGEPDMLRQLAAASDGAIIDSRRGVAAQLARMSADASAYYLVTYRSDQPADGRFRDVQVDVRKRGVRVRARRGYWALFPDEQYALNVAAAGGVPKPKLPPEFDQPWHVSPLIRAWFGTSRGPDGRTEVTFVWEPVPRVPGDRSRRPPPARVVLKALSADGTTVFDGPVRPADDDGLAGAPDSEPARAVFDVAPGRLRLHMSIEDGAAQRIDEDVRDIAVRKLDAPVTLGTPQVLRARTALELRALEADSDAVPVASRAFSRTETLLIRVPAYAPDGPPRLQARLLSRFGQAIRALPVTPAAAGRPGRITLPLASFAPGDYVIELTASSRAGVARDLIDFHVNGT